MGLPADAAALQQLLLAARQCLKASKPERALELLDAAFKLNGAAGNPLAHFVAGSARAALSQHAAAAAAFRQAAALTSGAEPSSTRHQLHVTATDNLLLEAERVLPPSWLPALHDAPRLAALQAGIGRAVATAAAAAAAAPSSPAAPKPPRVLVLGGFGVEAVLAAKAGAASVSALCLDNPLAAELTAQMAADSGCAAAAVTTATAVAQLAGQPPFDLVILADALSSSLDWQVLRRQLGAVAHLLAPGAAMLPHAVRLRGCVVECPAAVALNEVDVPLLRADTGGLDLAPANRLLPRPARSVRLHTQPHTRLTAAATLLTVPLASLLPISGGSSGSDGSGGDASAAAAAITELPIIAAGSADALAWWPEQELIPASSSDSPAELILSSDPLGCSPQEAQLLPHVWQRLQFMDRRLLATGQAVEVRCTLGCALESSAAAPGADAAAAGEALQGLSLENGGQCNGSAAGSAAGGSLDVQLDVLLAGSDATGAAAGASSLLLPVTTEQAAIAAAVPRYHTSMLNDSVRTAAYRDGIAAALQLAAERMPVSGSASSSEDAPLVLEIGSGSGLLCLLAWQAGARAVIGCERLPELQAAAAKLLETNGVADRVTILPKHSRELTVAATSAAAEAGQPAAQLADLPRRAQMLMHEIFGTDPFSEGVVPSLLHAREQLLAPAAVLAPCSVRVVAAVAASPTQHRLLRPPATVCGGAVATRALRQLSPRKVDCQAGEAGELHLLTAPAAVLEVDFASPELQLADSCTALLECLPRPLPLASWMAEQQRAAEGSCGAAGGFAQGSEAHAAAVAGSTGAADGQAVASCGELALEGASLYTVSWFEYEFPGGAAGSTAPHVQRSEHWQQVVQPMEGEAAEALLCALRSGSGARSGSSGSAAGEAGGEGGLGGIGGLLLTAGYRVDRLWFELAGLAALADGSEEGEDDGDEEG
ncbi:hypothetical protein ABPG75_005539 [Micractinium tetrahymenae]